MGASALELCIAAVQDPKPSFAAVTPASLKSGAALDSSGVGMAHTSGAGCDPHSPQVQRTGVFPPTSDHITRLEARLARMTGPVDRHAPVRAKDFEGLQEVTPSTPWDMVQVEEGENEQIPLLGNWS